MARRDHRLGAGDPRGWRVVVVARARRRLPRGDRPPARGRDRSRRGRSRRDRPARRSGLVVLEREAGEWYQTAPFRVPIDGYSVRRIAAAAASLVRSARVPLAELDAAERERLELEPPASRASRSGPATSRIASPSDDGRSPAARGCASTTPSPRSSTRACTRARSRRIRATGACARSSRASARRCARSRSSPATNACGSRATVPDGSSRNRSARARMARPWRGSSRVELAQA